MSEYEMPRLKKRSIVQRTDTGQESKPITFTQCLVEVDNGNLFNLVFYIDDKSLVVPITKATARDLHRMLGLRFETDEDHETQKRAW